MKLRIEEIDEKKISELIQELRRGEIAFFEYSLKTLTRDRRILKEIAKQISQFENVIFIYQIEEKSFLITTTEERVFIDDRRSYA